MQIVRIARFFRRSLLTLAGLLLVSSTSLAQSAAFTYQGRLTDGGNPASGQYDMQFKLFDTQDVGIGAQQGATVTNSTVQVTNGVLTLQLDFGAALFDGAARFLEISVRPAGSTDPYVTLAPRQPVTAASYAVRSLAATAADSLGASCVNCVTSSQIASVEGTQITGAIPIESVPVGSGNYIQNAATLARQGKNGAQQEASFNIEGDGIIGGTLSANEVNNRFIVITGIQAGRGSVWASPNATTVDIEGAGNGFYIVIY